jgi:hypothetical protein
VCFDGSRRKTERLGDFVLGKIEVVPEYKAFPLSPGQGSKRGEHSESVGSFAGNVGVGDRVFRAGNVPSDQVLPTDV